MVQQRDKQSLSVTKEVPNELSISFLHIPDSQTSANCDHFKKEKARSNRINSKPVDRVAATFHHCIILYAYLFATVVLSGQTCCLVDTDML